MHRAVTATAHFRLAVVSGDPGPAATLDASVRAQEAALIVSVTGTLWPGAGRVGADAVVVRSAVFTGETLYSFGQQNCSMPRARSCWVFAGMAMSSTTFLRKVLCMRSEKVVRIRITSTLLRAVIKS